MNNDKHNAPWLREGVCEWYLMCENEASTLEVHPILGDVAICERCKAKNERLRA